MEEWREDEGWGKKELERVYVSMCLSVREGEREKRRETRRK